MHAKLKSEVLDCTFPFLNVVGIYRNFNRAIMPHVLSSRGTWSRGNADSRVLLCCMYAKSYVLAAARRVSALRALV